MPDPKKLQLILQELIRRANNESRRLRTLEQQLNAIETRLDSLEEVSVRRYKKSDLKFVETDGYIRNTNEVLLKLKNDVDKLNKQVVKFANKRDIKELEKMFDLLNPISQEFVTKESLDREVEEEVKEGFKELKRRSQKDVLSQEK
ncbi:MAG: hypothetical protein J4473_05710 [Candidatus Aenigmarchaeota archaeon]|nr:hypothetical protein [Candidatus Aenigmarchaeota archaeon]